MDVAGDSAGEVVGRKAPACGRISDREREALLKEAARAQRALAEDRLDDAEAHARAFLEQPGNDQIWGLGLLQAVYRRLRERDPSREEELRHKEEELSARILAAGGGSRRWAHAWEHARQLNDRAWRAYERAEDEETLFAALADVEESLQFWPYFLPHLDTRVRILLALHLEAEAWRTVRWCEAMQPGWVDFADIVADRRYRKWERHQSSPPAVPAGRATAGPVVPAPPSSPASVSGPLRPDERVRLLSVRTGDDEWHRARNDALIALALDSTLPFHEARRASPVDFDLSAGVWRRAGGELPLSPLVLERLRHCLLFVCTNHEQMQRVEGKRQLRKALFLEQDLRPMTRRSVDRLFRQVGEAAGIPDLTPERCQLPAPPGESAIGG